MITSTVTIKDDSYPEIHRAIDKLLDKVHRAEMAQPLPAGWRYERHDVSRKRDDGGYEITITSTPVVFW